MGSRAVGRLAAASAVVVALVAMQGVAVAAHQWSIEAAAVPAGSNPSTLLEGVSCPLRSSCIAVGGFSTDSARGPLVERWDGASWAIESAPNPEGGFDGTLRAVSCPSPAACEAVGYASFPDGFRPFAERWDGSAWTAQSVPFPGGDEGDLEGVSCAGATDCVAVGRDDTSGGSNGFLVRWDGSTWTTQTAVAPPQAAELHGVSCSATAACTAVRRCGRHPRGRRRADAGAALGRDIVDHPTQPDARRRRRGGAPRRLVPVVDGMHRRRLSERRHQWNRRPARSDLGRANVEHAADAGPAGRRQAQRRLVPVIRCLRRRRRPGARDCRDVGWHELEAPERPGARRCDQLGSERRLLHGGAAVRRRRLVLRRFHVPTAHRAPFVKTAEISDT